MEVSTSIGMFSPMTVWQRCRMYTKFSTSRVFQSPGKSQPRTSDRHLSLFLCLFNDYNPLQLTLDTLLFLIYNHEPLKLSENTTRNTKIFFGSLSTECATYFCTAKTYFISRFSLKPFDDYKPPQICGRDVN